ncbi:L-2-hydroxyglutarate oxidase [Glycomyces algeriensis]|uniref:Hydroxyglutarate oxidase n=1 Tax=Glycomyces algeriensis TaxID=256037 RepID=A0A9W6LHV4_9ACTN|nr:L-2-hydroxyglutarate oxidase [Glycomyces algeriensis]MDA1364488.1 L-2-hydroxyglutarate oxidase [Glycomyces algeriensis]MDR7350521.1 L-2-hydroxyglutarate oxidase LhgO [Glycomyces algeriensis]GLI43229.1 hydroxyglutarate oxidase [Glycomyces algeriensis]
MADEVLGVVGAGIVGLAVARELARRRPGARVVVFEKEDRVAAHQTSHNSGVVHAGIYYVPGSLKARLCTRGVALLKAYCAEHKLPYVECGKLVVAVREEEVPRMDALYGRAVANGVPGLRRVGPEELREIEPHATGLGAIHSPGSAITDYAAVARAFAAEVTAAGGEVRLGFPVDGIEPAGSRVRVASGEERVTVDHLVLCAGLQADRVAALAGDEPGPRIVPFRGEYLRVKNAKAEFLRGLVYPVPVPGYPFLGVHFTRRIDSGTVEIGPNAVLALAAEGYRWRDLSPAHIARLAAWPGAWRMAARHWRMGALEVYGSVSKRAYMETAQQYFPEIGFADVERDGAGVRAQALDRDGGLVDDFRIHRLGPVTAVRNAPSPAATSSMAIAEHVVEQVLEPASGFGW